MVRLDRIYTGGGDKGETSLAGGVRVAKQGLRITAMGEVDVILVFRV
jgi:cob(I)alamin adenosyltransferase